MKSSALFSDYMVASSVNRSIRSINHSPTSGIIHKHRNSYGPQLTLLGKSRDNIEGHHISSQKAQQFAQKILLLSLQVQRLTQLNNQLKNQQFQSLNSSNKISSSSKQLTLMKQTNESLKVAIKTLQTSLNKSQEQKVRIKTNLQLKINELEVQVKNYQWKIKQKENYLERIEKTLKQTQFELEKQRIEKSKLQLIQAKNSKSQQFYESELQTRYSKQTSYLKDRISYYQSYTAQLKQSLTRLQQQNQRLQNHQAELMLINHQYLSQFQQIKKRINYELVQTGMNTQIDMSQMRGVYQKLRRFQQQEYMMNRQLEQAMKEKENVIYQLKQNNYDFREKCQQLELLVNEKKENQFYQHKRFVTIEQGLKLELKEKQMQIGRLKEDLNQLNLENGLLKGLIQEQAENMQSKHFQIQNKKFQISQKLRKTQRKLRNIQRQKRNNTKVDKNEIQNIYMLNNIPTQNHKLFKSRSIDSTSFFASRRGIDVSLQNIVSTAFTLQSSNQRSLRLINKSQQKISMTIQRFKNSTHSKTKRKVFIAQKNDVEQIQIKRNFKQQEQSQLRLSKGSSLSQRSTQQKGHKNNQKTVVLKQSKRLTNGAERRSRNTQFMKSSVNEYYGQEQVRA